VRDIKDYTQKINNTDSIRILFQEHYFKSGISGQVYQIHEAGLGETYLFVIFKELTHVVITDELVNQTREEIIKECRERLNIEINQ
jgi:hypothetical protein